MLGSALQYKQGVARQLRALPGSPLPLDQERHQLGAGEGERESWKPHHAMQVQRILLSDEASST